MATKELI